MNKSPRVTAAAILTATTLASILCAGACTGAITTDRGADAAVESTSDPGTPDGGPAAADAAVTTDARGPVDAGVGKLSFSLDVSNSGATGNCRSTQDGGAGITGVSIVVTADDGRCVDAELQRIVAGTSLSTYEVNCSAPSKTNCVGDAETLSAKNLPSGSYTIKATGFVGEAACWSGLLTASTSAKTGDAVDLELTRSTLPQCATAPAR